MQLQSTDNQTLIVIGRKYNDIFYALSTEEWNLCKKHILLIVPNRARKESFAYTELFDEIIILPSDKNVSVQNLPSYILRLRKMLSHLYGDYIMMSNPEMLFNRFIVHFSHSKNVIFLEDGLMNYYNYTADNGFFKQMLSFLFSVNDSKYFQKISKTYLHNPEMAQYYFGTKSKLNLSDNVNIPESLNIPNLNNKKLFIAQDVLNVGERNIVKQEALFNDIISYFKIDYYVPRTDDFKEKISRCEILNINNSGYTLEVLARKYDFEIYGFTTSLLFTAKMINPNIKSIRIKSKQTNHLKVPLILKEYADDVVYFA